MSVGDAHAASSLSLFLVGISHQRQTGRAGW